MVAKLELILLLQGRGMDADDLRRWYRRLDWLLVLPKEYDARIFGAIVQKEKENAVPYVTYAERRGLEQGLLEGKKGSIEAVLEVRFPQDAPAMMPAVRQIGELAELDRLIRLATTASLEVVRSALAQRPVS